MMTPTEWVVATARAMNCRRYLELGVASGFTLDLLSRFCRAVGVDIEDCREYFGGELLVMSTDAFFVVNKDFYDLIFVDAFHECKQVLRDFENSLRWLSRGGVILIHDTDPAEARYAVPETCGNVWKIHGHLEERRDVRWVTLPLLGSGMTVVTRADNRRFPYLRRDRPVATSTNVVGGGADEGPDARGPRPFSTGEE